MAFADAASRLSTLSIPTTIFHNCHSYSVSSSPASSPPTSSTATRRRAGPSQYTPPDDSASSSSSSAYSTTGAFTTMPYAQQEPQARHQVQQPYPSPPPTMQAFQHSLPPLHQQQLPPLSSIVPQSSPFASHHRLQQQRIRTKSSGAAVTRQHLPAVQPMLQADRTSHHTSAFAYSSYGQPGPSSQVKAPSSTSNMPTPSNGSVNGQQQQQQPPRMAQGRQQQQQQHLAPTNHTPESGRTSRIANFVAHNTCAMICYIWFADPRPLTPASENPPATSSSSDPPASSLNPYSPSFPAPQSNPTSARLQFCPTKQFTDFMHSLLTTTQVSQGVIVLSLCYIFRLKRQNPGIVAQPGSELRLAVVGLMLANKFLDDNTYTNLTWSQIAKIPLADINNMEREFLGGLGHQLFIDQKAYEGWLLMLNGLMWAKERAYDGWRRMMYGSAQASAMVSSTERGRNGASLVLAQATPNHRPHIHALPRARSTSPIPTTAPASAFPFTFTLPPLQQPSSNPFSAATTPTRPQYHHQLPPPQPQSQLPTQLQPPPIPTATRPTTAGSKRTLGDASFSPDLKPPPAKRPLSGSFAALADHAMTVAPQQQQQQQPRPAPLQPSYVATATAYNPQQHQHQHHHQTAQPAPSSYRIPSASEMLGIESHSNASSDDSRASSGVAEMPSSSMVTIGGYADGSGELRAALGRMSLEPSAVRGQDMVMVKQEEIDDVEDEEDVDDVKEEDEDMMASHVRGESVVEHLLAPYHADEKLVSRGLPQYLTYHTLAASPSVMVDARQQAPQPVPAQSQAVVIPPPASSQEAHHAFGARDRGKTITRVQVNNFPVQHIQPPYMPVNSAANTAAFSIAPAGRTASFAHLGSRSARTSPTGLGFGSGVRGGFVGGMDVDSSYAPRHVSQPQRQVSMQRLQQQQQPSYPTAQQASSTVPSVSGAGHPRLPPLQTQHIIPPPATAAATTTSSNNNHYHQPSHSHYASSPYANNHTNQTASYVNQPQGSFANAGPPGYQWPTNGSNGFFTGGAPNGSGHGNNNGYSAPTAAAVATPVHPFGDHHHYAPQSSQYGHQQDARWGYQQTQHLAQGQQAM